MRDFLIVTDSCCDMPNDVIKKHDIRIAPLLFTIEGIEYRDYPDGRDMSNAEFYRLLRSGKDAKTSAVNTAAFDALFREIIEQGHDVLYIGMSSGISCTVQNGEIAAKALQSEFPDRNIFAVDSLCASCGLGLLVYNACLLRESGAGIMEVRDYCEKTKHNVAHWFTVDDLIHLQRGGRLKAGAAVIGTALKIKPIMHADENGRLSPVSKACGRKMALKKLVEKAVADIVEPEKQTMFMCQGDCLEDAEYVKRMLLQQLPIKDVIIGAIGAVIGAHAGAGAISVFYIGKQR